MMQILHELIYQTLGITVGSKKLGHRPGTIYAMCPHSQGFGVGRQSYSNLPASTVKLVIVDLNVDSSVKTTFHRAFGLFGASERGS